jgi:hypothetical protein
MTYLTAGTQRRYADVVAESLRNDIRAIAEGLISLGAKIDACANPNDLRD